LGRILGTAGELLPNVTELEAIRKARQLREKGLTLRRIAARLAEEQHLARTGRRYDPRSISNLLSSTA